MAAILDFPVSSVNIPTISNELPELENVGFAVGISFLSHLQGDIRI